MVHPFIVTYKVNNNNLKCYEQNHQHSNYKRDYKITPSQTTEGEKSEFHIDHNYY